NAVVTWLTSPSLLLSRGLPGDGGKIGFMDQINATPYAAQEASTGAVNDVDTAALFAERQARLALLRGEGPRMLHAGNWRRAAELCRAWSNLEFWNPDPWRCLGYALQAQRSHQDAMNAFRKASQYDPRDPTLHAP